MACTLVGASLIGLLPNYKKEPLIKAIRKIMALQVGFTPTFRLEENLKRRQPGY
jgi:hypothetical protein